MGCLFFIDLKPLFSYTLINEYLKWRTEMNKLYMVSIGGKVERSNIEVHDLQFVIAETIEETYETLRSNWYGIPESLHMDSYTHICGVDGYKIDINESEKSNDVSLYFVNFGGYNDSVFQEQHHYVLVAASSEKAARSKAVSNISSDLKNIHVDNIVELNNEVLHQDNLHIHLIEDMNSYKLDTDWHGFKTLG